MLDIGWSELLVVAIILIVVVGPKDLPPMLRAFGKMTSNLRRMAGEFRTQFDDALKEADLDDVRKTIADAKSLNPASSLREALNPLRQVGEDIKADLRKVTTPPVTPATEPLVDAPETPEVLPASEVLPVPVAPPAEVTQVETAQKSTEADKIASPAVAPAADAAALPKKPARKPRAPSATKTDAGAKSVKKADAADEKPAKKAAPRKKKTTEPGKDEA